VNTNPSSPRDRPYRSYRRSIDPHEFRDDPEDFTPKTMRALLERGKTLRKMDDRHLSAFRKDLASPIKLPEWRLELLAGVMVEHQRRGYSAIDLIGEQVCR
jgi:hypothetical protein